MPSEMVQQIVEQLPVADYAALSMVNKDAQACLENLRLLQPVEMAERQTVHQILTEDSHFFLTGAAGTGKSHTLRMLHQEAKRRRINIGMTAVTGIAATNLPEGRTLHSFTGIPLDIPIRGHGRRIRGNRSLIGLKILVIDEASMLRGEMLDILDIYLRGRNIGGKLMGGVKLVFVGDFFQLGPVKSEYVFKTLIWQRLNPIVIEHTRPIRQQKDLGWFRDLSAIRRGQLTVEIFERLCRLHRDVNEEELLDGKHGTLLMANNSLCDGFNERAFARNPNPVLIAHTADDQVYKSINGVLKQSNDLTVDEARRVAEKQLVRIPKTLELKDGALYVLTKNLETEVGHVKGLVCRFDATERLMRPLKMRMPDEGEESGSQPAPDDAEEIAPIELFEVEFLLRLRGDLVLSRTQIPFRLAYALTIHSSQGMTLQRAVMNMGSSIFAAGQMYTGLSRTKSRNSLLLTDLDPRSVRVNKSAVMYYDTLQNSERYVRR